MKNGVTEQTAIVGVPKDSLKNEGARNQPKLTDWQKEPTVMDLKSDLDASKPSHDAHSSRVKHWDHLRNVTGEAAPPKVKGRSSIQPKLIRRQAEWRYSALSEPFLSQEKLFEVNPRTFEDEQGSRQNELVLNWQANTKINKVRFIDEYVRTCVDEGTVIVKLGWKRDSVPVEVQVPIYGFIAIDPQNPMDQEDVQALQEAMEFKQKNLRGYMDMIPEDVQAAVDYTEETGIPVKAVVQGMEMEQDEKILENRPTLQIMHPDNVFIDPSCEGDYQKAKFIICSFETNKAELKKDGRYKNLDSVNWSSQTPLSLPDHATTTPNDFMMKDDLRRPVVAHEYWGWWDINGDEKLVPIVATWIGDTLIRMEENPFPDEKPPFVVVPYLPIKREVMGEPDAEILEDNQRVLGAVTRGMIDLMGRSANSQQGYAKGYLDVTNKRRFERGEDYEFNPGTDPRTSVFQHTYPEIPNSALTMMQLQNQEAEAMSGVKSFSGGVSGEAYGDVAAGIRGVLDASSKREMNILRRLAKGIQDIGVKMMLMNQVFLSEEEVIRVTNKEFVTVKREDLKGNYDLMVDISTAEVDEKKAQDLGFIFQTIGPNMDPNLSKMVLSDIARLKKMPALAERIMQWEPQPDPVAEQLKQAEVQEKMVTIAKLQAETDELLSRIELNRARARGEIADAVQTQVETENEASGVEHMRDMEKQKAQSQGNQSLEVTKSLLKPEKEGERRPQYEAAVGFNELQKIMDRGTRNPVSPEQQSRNLGSQSYNPALDPAMNPGMRL